MKHWKEKAELKGDVVFFSYVQSELEKASSEVLIWDLDKTYLDTTIDSIGGILRAAVERAFSKKNIPGTNILLQRLSIEQEQRTGNKTFPIYFITASPPQIEERMVEKFMFDEIRPMGCFYKDNLRNLRPGRFWRLTKHVGFKVQALLQLRLRLSENVKQVCFGDDSESDAVIYNLYSDICARRITPNEIRIILGKFFVSSDQIDDILRLQSRVPENDPVEKIYINLATDTDPEYYLKFGRRTLATYSTYQIALDLFQDGRLTPESLLEVARDMMDQYGFTPDELTKSLDELIRRGTFGRNAYERISSFLTEHHLVYHGYKPSVALLTEKEVRDGRVYSLEGMHDPWLPERIDYLHEDR